MDRMAESFQLWYIRISATHNVLSDQEGIGGIGRNWSSNAAQGGQYAIRLRLQNATPAGKWGERGAYIMIIGACTAPVLLQFIIMTNQPREPSTHGQYHENA